MLVLDSCPTDGSIFGAGELLATVSNGGSGGGGISTSTPAIVQSTKDSATSAATFLSGVTSGNLIVVAVSTWNASIPSNSVTDNKGNTYTRITE